MTDLQDRICGAVLASALADPFSAPYEGGPMERLLRGTSCGYRQLPEVLLKQLEQRRYLEELAHRFADAVVRGHF